MSLITKRSVLNFSYLSLANVVLMIVGIVSSAIWARYAEVNTYGKYQLIISFLSLVTVLSMPGLAMSAQLSSAKNHHGNFKPIVRKKIQFSILSSVVLALIGLYYQVVKSDTELSIMIYILAFLFPIYNLKGIWESWMTAIDAFGRLSILQIICSGLSLASIATGLILYNKIYYTVFIVFGSLSILNIFIVFKIGNTLKNNVINEESVSYGYKYSGVMIIPIVLAFDKIIISEFLTVRDVAIYSIAATLPAYSNTLYAILNKLLTPRLSRATCIIDAWLYIKNKIVTIYVVFIVIAIIGYYIIPILIPILFTEKYMITVQYSQWLWIVINLTIPVTFILQIMRIHGKLKFLYFYEFVNAIGKCSLYIILLPYFNIWGMIYSITIVNMINIISVVTYFSIIIIREREESFIE